MAKSNKNLHLTLSERQIIQRGIENGATKASIAATLGKASSSNYSLTIETYQTNFKPGHEIENNFNKPPD